MESHSEGMELTIVTPDHSVATSPVRTEEPRGDPRLQEVAVLWDYRIEWFDDEGNSLGFEAQPIPAQAAMNRSHSPTQPIPVQAAMNRSHSPTQEGLDANHLDDSIPSPGQSMSEGWSPESSSSNFDLTRELLHLIFETRRELDDLKYKMEQLDQIISLLVALHARSDIMRKAPSLS
jgi:hypothetical protein